MSINFKEVEQQAIKEFEQERFREAVEKCKTKLRLKKPWWYVIFPYRIFISIKKV